jgi:hypothetical protein
MKRVRALLAISILLAAVVLQPAARAYVIDTTVPQAGGCPQPQRWNLSLANPLNRRWSTSLSSSPFTLVTAASNGSGAQLDEIAQAISDSFGAWSGVSGTTFNAVNYPGLVAPLGQVATASACTDDQENKIDGLNTICFNQSSTSGFTTGVLAFTRVITANAPGVSVGNGPPAAFTGQILDADTLFRNDGQATFATPAGLSTQQGVGAYDLESLLIHELGHWFALDHSGVWRSIMFPYAPPPGQFLGERPTVEVPDGPLADDDRTGVRSLYPDPNDAVDIGSISGKILPANPFALAAVAAPAPGSAVTGIVGAQVVVVDADSGAVIAATLAGWSCDAAHPPLQFDGSYDIERLPVNHNYLVYAEPLTGLAAPADFSGALNDLCATSGPWACTTPPVDTNFTPLVRPSQ